MLEVLDWVVVAVYFLLLLAIVWRTSRKQNSAKDYFLASRNIGWFAIGASLFASNIGSEHIVGLAGQGAATGLAFGHYELHAWLMLTLGWVFVPFYYTTGVSTMPEFLERRFGATARWILSLVSLTAYVLTKVSVTVYAGALVFETLLPDIPNAFWFGAFATVILTGIYTMFGGMRAVLYTDSAQAIILLIGSFAITWFGLQALGGWSELQAFAATRVEQYALWRPLDDPTGVPWLGILIASPIVGMWYWCTDQFIVQRTLAAKDLRSARRGTIWGAALKVWPIFIFLIPGLIGAALHAKGVIQIPPDKENQIAGDKVFPTLVTTMLPVGMRGLVIGGMLAALMSSLSSLFNSSATLFTIDIFQKLRPKSTDQQLVWVGRMATLAVVILGMLWIPIMRQIGSEGGLYKYLQNVQGYLAPPITAVFLLGLFYWRTNKVGAVAGMAIGFLLGIAKLTIEVLFSPDKNATDLSVLERIAKLNFLYFSAILFAFSVIIIVALSHLTTPPDQEKIRGLTYASIDKKLVRESWTWVDVLTTAIVLGLTLATYLYFSFWI